MMVENLVGLDPFRKMFKCQKTPVLGTSSCWKFYRRCRCI